MRIRRLLILGLLLFGILFGIYARFANVGQKVYTVDEVRGLLRASGVTSQEFVETVYTNGPIANSELQKYQTASSDRTLGDALNALAGNPEHPPLYYLLMRFSLQLFHTAAASRWLAVTFSLLLLPAIYWLCQILFASASVNASAVGWSTVILIALSPFHVLLAQEARQYTIWAFFTVVSSAFLLQALQINRRPDPIETTAQAEPKSWIPWLAYGMCAMLGMYSHLFFTWVLVTHGLYVSLSERVRLGQKLLRYIVTSAGVSVAFLPWVWVVISRSEKLSQTTKWASTYSISLLERVEYWLHNVGIGFIDFDWPAKFNNPVSYLMLGAIAYSTYQLYRHTSKKTWLFVILLMSVSTLMQVIPDVISGGRRSLFGRYSLPAYLGIEIAVGYGVAQAFTSSTKVSDMTTKGLAIKGKQLAAIALILGSIASSSLITQSLDWGKGSSKITLRAANVINQTASSASAPVILSDVDHTYGLSLSHYIAPDAQFILSNREQNPNYAAALSHVPNSSDFFIFFASEPLMEFLQATPEVTITPQTREMRLGQIYQAQRRSK